MSNPACPPAPGQVRPDAVGHNRRSACYLLAKNVDRDLDL